MGAVVMIGSGARERFRANEERAQLSNGLFIASIDPAVTEIVGGAGFDFVIIDTEHSPMGPPEVLAHVRSAELVGVVPLVRIPELSRPMIQKMIDIGAEGVVVPHIETAQEAEQIVRATRLPPRGERSISVMVHATRFSWNNWLPYVEHSDGNFLSVPIVESLAGFKNLEEILSVEGIDYVFLGLGDLSVDIGVPLGDPVLGDYWTRAQELAAAAAKHLITTANIAGIQAGVASAVVHSYDLRALDDQARAILAKARASS
jgi:4-hydroxy-2-oxoheptanedioate aldolase